jgi:hypothetical protein
MKKFVITAVIGALSASLVVAADASAATTNTTPTQKKPEPKRRVFKKHASKAAAKPVADAIPAGSSKWSCAEEGAFYLSGDMKRDQIVTVHWSGKNYKLPREMTTTGADRFHDAATGLDLVVIPTKAMLFSDKDSSRLADECKTPEMVAGEPAPTQSEALKRQLQQQQGQ